MNSDGVINSSLRIGRLRAVLLSLPLVSVGFHSVRVVCRLGNHPYTRQQAIVGVGLVGTVS